jgi:NAD dependent epimerase/dehydratase
MRCPLCFRSFYEVIAQQVINQRILVTGADGFIGSHLVEMLLKRGFHVKALALYNSHNFYGWLEQIPKHDRFSIVSGDVRDPYFCASLTHTIDCVFHLASLIAIPYSYQAAESYIATNVQGTMNMCQAARASGIKRFIQLSTSEVYGTAQYVPMCEAHPLRAQSPYSASKIGADAVATSFYHSFDLPVTIARPFNVFGPRQSARAVIPSIIGQLLQAQGEVRLGDITPTRDFTFVKDTCAALLAIMESPHAIGETINIGSGFETSIEQIVNAVADLMSTEVVIKTEQERKRPEKSEVSRLYCDNSKLQSLTGFVPRVSFEAGLQETIAWFSRPENAAKYKMNQYNV